MSSSIAEQLPAVQPKTIVDSGLRTDSRFSIVKDALINAKPYAADAARQYLLTLDEALGEMRIRKQGPVPLDDAVLANLDALRPYSSQFRWFCHLLARHGDDDIMGEQLIACLGNLLRLKAPPGDEAGYNYLYCDNFRFFLREMFVSVVAIFIKEQCWQAVDKLISANYSWVERGVPRQSGFVAFDAHVRSLDDFRRRRLGANRLSLSVDLLRERANLTFFSFDDIMQADFVLCLRRLLDAPGDIQQWYPRSLAFAENYQQAGFDLFFRAQSREFFAPVKTVLGVSSKDELIRRFSEAAVQSKLDDWRIGEAPIPFEQYMALSRLETA